jgi:hypothetical protein
MNRLAFALTLALTASAGIAAQPAATLASANGSVLVNQGKQFVSAQPGQMLAAGDRVMIMQGGNATVRFADGCVKNLEAGSLLLVKDACTTSSMSQVAAISAQALGEERDCDGDDIPDSKDDDIDGDGKLNADDNNESCKAGALIWIAGGVGLAASAALISDGDDETISP